MRTATIIIVIVVVLAGLGVGAAVMMKSRQAKSADTEQTETVKAVAVATTKVTARDLDERVAVTGTLQPADQVTVGTQFPGRVAWVIGKEGTPVHRGDVVARLEDQDIRAQLRSADAAVRAAEARLEQAKAAAAQQLVSTDTGIRTAQAALQAAQARVEQAKAAAAQQTTSTGSGIQIAEAALETARAQYEQARTTAGATEAALHAQVKAAQAALDGANQQLTILRNGARPQEVAQAESNVRMTKAAYDNDQTNYDRYKMLYDKQAVARAMLDGAEAKMRVSKAQYDAALEQLNLVKEGPRREEIAAAEAAARQAQEGLTTAQANLKQIDVAQANVEIARTGVQQAQARLEEAKSVRQVDVMRDKDVLAAQAGVEQARQALAAARASRQVDLMRDKDVLAALTAVEQAREGKTIALQALDDTNIYSPVNGVVASKLAQVGQSMGSGDPVLVLATDQTLFFEAQVSELEATRLSAGQPVRISVDALRGDQTSVYGTERTAIVTGAVEKVVPVVDARTRNFTVRIVVPAHKSLFPGMFARGEIIVARHPDVLTVPKEALVTKGDRRVIFTVHPDKTGTVAREREVALGVSDSRYLQVRGLTEGDEVVITGQQTLMDGDPVTVQAGDNDAVPASKE